MLTNNVFVIALCIAFFTGMILGTGVRCTTNGWFLFQINLGQMLHIMSLYLLLFIAHGYFIRSHSSHKHKVNLVGKLCEDLIETLADIHRAVETLSHREDLVQDDLKTLFTSLRGYGSLLYVLDTSLNIDDQLRSETDPNFGDIKDDYRRYRSIVGMDSALKSITQKTRKEETYRYWKNLSNLRRFQFHIASMM